MVEISKEGEEVVMRMSSDEAKLLAFSVRAGFESTSRAEYWIRHGLTRSSVRALQTDLYGIASGARDRSEVILTRGVEAEENPRRAHPPSR